LQNINKILDNCNDISILLLTRDPIAIFYSEIKFFTSEFSYIYVGLHKCIPEPLTYRACNFLYNNTSYDEFVHSIIFDHYVSVGHHKAYHTLLPFLKNKIKNILIIDTEDILMQNIELTMKKISKEILNNEIFLDIRRQSNIGSTDNWFFTHYSNAFPYQYGDIQFVLHPFPEDYITLYKYFFPNYNINDSYITYNPKEIEFNCGQYNGNIAFFINNIGNIVNVDLNKKIKSIIEADEAKILREYCRNISKKYQLSREIYEDIVLPKYEFIQLIRNNPEIYTFMEKLIYAQAAALWEFGYDVTHRWKDSITLLGVDHLDLSGEYKYSHLYDVIDTLLSESNKNNVSSNSTNTFYEPIIHHLLYLENRSLLKHEIKKILKFILHCLPVDIQEPVRRAWHRLRRTRH
jgi:hypothetical protein